VLLNLRLWPTVKILSVVLLIAGSAVLTNTVRYRHDKTRFLRALTEQKTQLQQAEQKLQETKHLLATAEKKLGFLSQHKTTVQVTAFTGQGSFASGQKTAQSYAVPNHVLPEDKVLSIALSPTARRNLHAQMNDYIVLLDKHQQKARLARFVDTTSANELRPVVDVFFAQQEEARTFGRQHYLAVNISAEDSPFQEK
jgi:3D (Asp-Asp-Asp) domain-containing protein